MALLHIKCEMEEFHQTLTEITRTELSGSKRIAVLLASEDVGAFKETELNVVDINRWRAIISSNPNSYDVLVIDGDAMETGDLEELEYIAPKIWVIKRLQQQPTSGTVRTRITPEGRLTGLVGGIDDIRLSEGMSIHDLLVETADNIERLEERYQSLKKEGWAVWRGQVRCMNGGTKWLEFRETLVLRDDELIETQTLVVDVTEVVWMERELKDMEERFLPVAKRSMNVVYRRNLQTGNYDYLSPSILELTGYPITDHLRDPDLLAKLVVPADREKFSTIEIPDDRDESAMTYKIEGDHGTRWVWETRTLVKDRKGVPYAIEGALTDITALMMRYDDLSMSDEMRITLERAGTVFISVDTDGTVSSMSEGAIKLMSMSSSEYIGQSIYDMVADGDSRKRLEELLHKIASWSSLPENVPIESDDLDVELQILSKDGSRHVIHLKAIPSEKFIHLIGFDVTHEVELVESYADKYCEIEECYNELRDILDKRTEFMNMTIHDLKAPMLSLRGNLDILKLSIHEDDQLHRIKAMEKSLETLTTLTMNLRDVIGIESNSLPLDVQNVDLSSLVIDVMESLKSTAEERGISTILEVADGITVAGDGGYLRRVFSNLISNAIQYTAEGYIAIKVEGEGDNVHISVKDTGEGIPEDLLKVVFERFYTTSSERGGMGLGLYIAKKIVELHGGKVWAESVVGKGTTMHVVLPLIQDTDTEMPIGWSENLKAKNNI
ncbi:MAG: sensor histidine kinase [Methermicoccaceae archaeon]